MVQFDRPRQVKPKRAARTVKPKAQLTQAELLAEAANTEIINTRSLALLEVSTRAWCWRLRSLVCAAVKTAATAMWPHGSSAGHSASAGALMR